MVRRLLVVPSSILLGSTFVNVAEAKPKFAKCPAFVVDDSRKSFQRFSSAFPGLRCSGNRKALLKLGYTESGGEDPKNVGTPELDTERVFRGRGDVTISRAFRVSSVGGTWNDGFTTRCDRTRGDK